MSDPGQVTCANCGTVSPASAPICQACGRALPGLADRLFADDSTPRGPDAGTTPPATAPPSTPASGRASLFSASTVPPAADAPPSPAPPPTAPAAPSPLPPPLPATQQPVWDQPAPAAPVDPAAPEPPKRRTALLLGVIIAVIVVATGAFLLFGGDDDPAPSATATSAPTDDTTATTAAPTTTVATEPPADPTGLTVTAAGPTSVELTWTDAADNEDRYLIGRVRSEDVDEIADLPADTTSYVVDALEPNTLYCFTVAATNGATGEPHFLPQVCAVTGT